tara:strand:+ start:1139 stop:1273 length:135 start_codon:yes stop_codon:yes gene_type:complete
MVTGEGTYGSQVGRPPNKKKKKAKKKKKKVKKTRPFSSYGVSEK